ncbi:hypothetical protein C8F04DRAFT_1183319 [Mycena alexandri]|uniref:Uncharacterized protein n=1 Tax=Mycena alexandri TaxID=1745969 RepID=A0AAD6SUF3_9AGAR|nr:hypothetical protein C8F04DRAFT_1183319 [Mycena alexandri]
MPTSGTLHASCLGSSPTLRNARGRRTTRRLGGEREGGEEKRESIAEKGVLISTVRNLIARSRDRLAKGIAPFGRPTTTRKTPKKEMVHLGPPKKQLIGDKIRRRPTFIDTRLSTKPPTTETHRPILLKTRKTAHKKTRPDIDGLITRRRRKRRSRDGQTHENILLRNERGGRVETSTRHAGDEENLLAKNRHKTPFTRHGGAQVRVYEYSGTTDYDYVVLSEFSETPVSSLALSNTEIPSDATAAHMVQCVISGELPHSHNIIYIPSEGLPALLMAALEAVGV